MVDGLRAAIGGLLLDPAHGVLAAFTEPVPIARTEEVETFALARGFLYSYLLERSVCQASCDNESVVALYDRKRKDLILPHFTDSPAMTQLRYLRASITKLARNILFVHKSNQIRSI